MEYADKLRKLATFSGHGDDNFAIIKATHVTLYTSRNISLSYEENTKRKDRQRTYWIPISVI
jgi:hypothetical protein